MSKPLSELVAAAKKAAEDPTARNDRAEDSYEFCIDQRLVSRIRHLTAQRDRFVELARRLAEDDKGRRRRAAEEPRDYLDADQLAELEEVETELDKLRGDFDDVSGHFWFRADDPREWQRFIGNHPPAEGESPDARPDVRYGLGWVSHKAVIDNLEKWAVRWDDEPLAEGQFEALTARASYGDLCGMALCVVLLNTQSVDPGKAVDNSRSRRTSSDD